MGVVGQHHAPTAMNNMIVVDTKKWAGSRVSWYSPTGNVRLLIVAQD